MKKIMMSGQCNMGDCGIASGMYDALGEMLYTGDVVAYSAWREYGAAFDFCGLAFIVADGDSSSDNSYFVMGLKSEHHAYFDGEPTESIESADFIHSAVYQNDAAWQLQKVKGWQDVVDGETVRPVRCVFIEEE